MYYGPDIIIDAGITIPQIDDPKKSALLLNIPLASVNAIGTLISMATIDRFGRRYIILRGLPFVIFSWIVVAIGMSMTGNDSNSTTGGIIAFIGIIFFLLSFSLSFSSTPWTINAEIYPVHVIGTATSLSTTVNWITNAILASVFLLTTKTVVGSVITYLLLAIFALAALIFTYYKVPETANRTIDEILHDILGQDYKEIESEREPTEQDETKN